MLQKNLDWCFATLIETIYIKMTYLTFFSLYTRRGKIIHFYFLSLYTRPPERKYVYIKERKQKFEFISSLRIIKLLMFFIFYRDIYISIYTSYFFTLNMKKGSKNEDT